MAKFSLSGDIMDKKCLGEISTIMIATEKCDSYLCPDYAKCYEMKYGKTNE